jgi:hypothetical protein
MMDKVETKAEQGNRERLAKHILWNGLEDAGGAAFGSRRCLWNVEPLLGLEDACGADFGSRRCG